MQRDTLSPTYGFLDFDFSEFIDKNFDMSNDLFNSPSTVNSTLLQLDDFISCSDESESKSIHYTHESPSLYPLWSNMQNLSLDKTPPTLSCIDDFIKDPHGDLVQLVQQCHTESSLFHNLITHSVNEHVPITPHQVLQQEQEQQQQLLLLQQQKRSINQHSVTQLPKQQLPFDLPLYPNEKIERKRKNTTVCTTQSQKRVPKSTSSSSSSSSSSNNYTHSDSVNAQLLRELIRQAGRTHTQNSSNSRTVDNSIIPSSDINNKTFMPAHGNYQSYRHHPYYKSSPALTSTSRHHLPYHIQTTKKISKQSKPVINRPPVSKSNHHPMGRPSMYSSDISQAQLLEIQAISRAQQDFIRAREQQEAEKEMMMKHQQKSKVPNM